MHRFSLDRDPQRSLTRQQKGSGDLTVSTVKATGETLGLVATATPDEVDYALVRAREAYEYLRNVPAPRRGEVVRQVRVALADKLDDLGALVSLEMGKVLAGACSYVDYADIFGSRTCKRAARVVRSSKCS